MKKKINIFGDTDKTESQKITKKAPKAERAPGNSPDFDNKGYAFGSFKPLGFDCEDKQHNYYFFVKKTMSIIRLTAAKMSKQTLLQLAGLEQWIMSYPTSNGGFDILPATDFLISICQGKGYFTLDLIRGRGAWKDNGQYMFNTGTHLICENIPCPIGTIETEYTYEQRKAIKIAYNNPLNYSESAELSKLLSSLNWKTAIDGKLLAGWITIAPICGILKWRPHLWLTGPKGNGKSWVLEQIVQPILGSFSVNAQGTGVTEPAIRQKLNSDAMPVTIDEGEGNDERAANRMQEVQGLARASSSENSGAIPKGGKDGKSIDYFVRSCFLIVSINPQLVHDSDKRRFTVLELTKHKDPKRFSQIEKNRNNIIVDDFGQRYQARIIVILKNLMKSIEIFTSAITELTDDKSIGDQYGALLGGWWHSFNDNVVSENRALEESSAILELRGFNEDGEELNDEQRCIQHILGESIMVQSEHFIGNRTIGELVEIAGMKHINGEKISREEANSTLMRLGLKVIWEGGKDFLLILNNSKFVQRTLYKTAWAISYPTVLSRLQTAVKRKQTRFSAGLNGRCISIELQSLL